MTPFRTFVRDLLAVPGRVAETNARLIELETIMVDVSSDLNDVAAGIDALNAPVAELIAENVRLTAENAGLRGLAAEDAAESAAAANVRTAYDSLVEKFASDELPDVEPLPAPVDEG